MHTRDILWNLGKIKIETHNHDTNMTQTCEYCSVLFKENKPSGNFPVFKGLLGGLQDVKKSSVRLLGARFTKAVLASNLVPRSLRWTFF
jgi:hypothetical protein